MNRMARLFGFFAAFMYVVVADATPPPPNPDVMSKEYWAFWNDDVQKGIDERIEKYRKADATVELTDVKPGAEVKIEQISHEFLFGGNIFLYGHFDTPEKNKKYEDTFGNLFNAATVPFYWKTLEPERGKPRYEAGSSFEYRRPPTDPVVQFCESKGINMNGHAIIYPIDHAHPEWMPKDRQGLEQVFEARVKELAERYQDRIQRWDIVNETVNQPQRNILLPDDYAYKSYSWAMRYFPDTVLFNTNDSDLERWDWVMYRRYVEYVRNLIHRGIRINYVGVQMHLFRNTMTKIAAGEKIITPEILTAKLNIVDEAERPIHISEVTIFSEDSSEKSQAIQAIVSRNLYRLWFGYPTTMGITWWNVVDGGAHTGYPTLSGLYDKDLNPKLAYHALDQLINHEWKTNIVQKAETEKLSIPFRGFKGKYKVSWTDKTGNARTSEIVVK